MSIHQAKGLEFPVVFVPDIASNPRGSVYPAARWHRELGCLVKPPDEDPPLFSKFGWELGKHSDEIAEWHESLRVLYVACTRARDHLLVTSVVPASEFLDDLRT